MESYGEINYLSNLAIGFMGARFFRYLSTHESECGTYLNKIGSKLNSILDPVGGKFNMSVLDTVSNDIRQLYDGVPFSDIFYDDFFNLTGIFTGLLLEDVYDNKRMRKRKS